MTRFYFDIHVCSEFLPFDNWKVTRAVDHRVVISDSFRYPGTGVRKTPHIIVYGFFFFISKNNNFKTTLTSNSCKFRKRRFGSSNDKGQDSILSSKNKK